jgi:hypothetical protein
MLQARHSRAWLTVAALAVVTTQQRAAAMQPSKPLPYCSHDMSSRGIPPLQASVLQSFGKSVSFADDVQVLQTQVNRRLIEVCGCLRCICILVAKERLAFCYRCRLCSKWFFFAISMKFTVRCERCNVQLT